MPRTYDLPVAYREDSWSEQVGQWGIGRKSEVERDLAVHLTVS